MFTAGIDGGGTSTRLEIRDAQGQVTSRHTFGPFNITAIGEEAFRAQMKRICAALGEITQASSLCIGGAGVSCGALEGIIRDELNRAGFRGRLTLCSDFEIALRGAMDGPGCILIAGTGSVGYGRGAAGESVRVGGWGHIIDDEGSGYAIGREALALTVQTADGRAHAQELARAVCAAIGAKDVHDVVDFVYYRGTDKSGIAALARTVNECALQGDEASVLLLRRQAEALRSIVEAMAQRLQMPHPRLALLGGLMEHDTPYRRLAAEILSACAQVIPPAHDALWGAGQIAVEALQ